MTTPEIETPSAASRLEGVQELERTVTIRGRFPGLSVQREGEELPTLFEPTVEQEEWMAAVLDRGLEDLDFNTVADEVGVLRELAGWRMQPGFVEWVEREITRAGSLEMAAFKAGVMARAARGDKEAGRLALKLFPQIVERRVVDPDAFEFTATERLQAARKRLEAKKGGEEDGEA